MPRIIDEHLGLGEHSFRLKTDAPDIRAELTKGRHVLYYQGEELRWCGPILQPPDRDGRVKGAGLDWWLGADQIGPTIRDREYVSSVSKLANGNFELEIPDLYWTRGRDGAWQITSGQAVLPAGITGSDELLEQLESTQVLQSQQEFDVEEGQQYGMFATAGRDDGGSGRLRMRPTLTGLFPARERMVNGSFEDDETGWGTPFPGPITIVTDPAEARTGDKVLRLGPNNRPNLADETVDPNPSFETAPTEPNEVADGWYNDDVGVIPADHNFTRSADAARSGGWGIRIAPTLAQPFEARYSDSTDRLYYINAIPVTAGEEHSAGVWVRSSADAFDGEISLRGRFVYPDGRPPEPAVFWHPVSPTQEDDEFTIGSAREPTAGAWHPCGGTFQVPDGATDLEVWLVARNIDGDTWDIDDLWCFARNTIWETVTTDDMQVETRRSYELSGWVRRDPAAVNGIVRLAVILTGVDLPEQVKYRDVNESTDGLGDEATLGYSRVDLAFTVPDGYTACRTVVACRNIDKACWWVDDVTLQTTDETTFEDLDDSLLWPALTGPAQEQKVRLLTIPAGAQKMRCEWIADSAGRRGFTVDGGGWRITGLAVIRQDMAPSTVGDVFRDLLRDPDDPSIQLLDPGIIHEPEGEPPIAFDVRWRNMHNRDALRYLARSGLAWTLCEWKPNPDRTVDFGPAELLFVDHDPRIDPERGFVLTADMFEIREPIDVADDIDELPTDVRIIGADLTDAFGQKRVLEATASTGVEGVTKDGDPLNRTLVVQASDLDLPTAVQAYADYTAAQHLDDDQVTVRLSDWRHLGSFARGDWIYVCDHDNELDDPANEMTLDDGTKVWPKRLRVIDIDWTLGNPADGKVKVLREDGTIRDLSDHIDWEGETAATLTLGNRLPDLVSDPQAGPASLQLLRLRHALTRAA